MSKARATSEKQAPKTSYLLQFLVIRQNKTHRQRRQSYVFQTYTYNNFVKLPYKSANSQPCKLLVFNKPCHVRKLGKPPTVRWRRPPSPKTPQTPINLKYSQLPSNNREHSPEKTPEKPTVFWAGCRPGRLHHFVISQELYVSSVGYTKREGQTGKLHFGKTVAAAGCHLPLRRESS